jgi:hypothetical protein
MDFPAPANPEARAEFDEQCAELTFHGARRADDFLSSETPGDRCGPLEKLVGVLSVRDFFLIRKVAGGVGPESYRQILVTA